MLNNLSYYGGYRTRKFTDIFPDSATFENTANDIGIPLSNINNKDLIYYLLYARYGNSHIAFSDETQFIYSLYMTIFQYGPTWEKRLDVQEKIRNLSDEELVKGGRAIYNHSFNPSSEPSTSTLEELLTINDQNTTNYKKSAIEGYALLLSVLETDVTEEFINKFRKLFIQVLSPDYPLLYTTEVNE